MNYFDKSECNEQAAKWFSLGKSGRQKELERMVNAWVNASPGSNTITLNIRIGFLKDVMRECGDFKTEK